MNLLKYSIGCLICLLIGLKPNKINYNGPPPPGAIKPPPPPGPPARKY